MRYLWCWLAHRRHHYWLDDQRMCWLCDDPGQPPPVLGWEARPRQARLMGAFA